MVVKCPRAAESPSPVIPLSVLDLSPVTTATPGSMALRNSLDLAQLADRLGYKRYWVAEHHNLANIASSAPEIMIGQIAAATSHLRVGSGGVMLPNHAPLVIAEQFATLEALHPGRIDLGLGRAPGTDHVTARALRRTMDLGADNFPNDVVELIKYLLPSDGSAMHPFANPGRGYLPEIWLLGSSTFSAQLAGILGLSFSFAYHFAPQQLDAALATYRESFRPSIVLREPHVMVAASVICAPSVEEATWQSRASALSIVQMRTGRPGEMPSPQEAAAHEFTPLELEIAAEAMSTHVIGEPETVVRGLAQLRERTAADEIMISTRVHSHEARIQSLELVAGAWGLPESLQSHGID
jgi:luciferase family oxidoreductase group 1